MSTRRRTAVIMIVAGVFWWLGAQPTGRAADGSGLALAQEIRSYSVGVGLVRLSVTARTSKGDIVHDLKPEEFQVFEEGVPQEVVRFGHHEAPISVVVLFDKSASMQGEKLMHAKDAVVNFARAFRPQDEILVVAFSDGIDALGDFGLDALTIEPAVQRIRVESSTRLYDAVIEGTRAIAGPERKEKRALLVLSDGEDTASRATLDETVEAVRRAGVPVYAIGIEMDDDDPTISMDPAWRPLGRANEPPPGLGPPWKRLGQRQAPTNEPGPSAAIRALNRVTEGMGGWTYRVVAAKRCKEVCIRVAEELRNQYLLGYAPPADPPGGAWRAVTVWTSRHGVTLATRQGYYGATP